MIRILMLVAILCGVFSGLAAAQDRSDTAQVDASKSFIHQNWRGRTELRLALTHGVPFRVFTLDAPPRLVIDFRSLEWNDVTPDTLMGESTGIEEIRFGVFQPGWSRFVADLSRPLLPEDVGMGVDETSGQAILSLMLAPASAEEFAAVSGVPDDVLWPDLERSGPNSEPDDTRFVVALDPGHGGIDPGAERDGLSEKELMLEVALSLRDMLLQSADIDVVLTREDDVFVSLANRVAQAHQARADMFLSLHADALSDGGAQGATVYLLSDQASDEASAYLAERHSRADIIAGADLSASDDQVTSVLLDLARLETEPRSEALARALVQSMAAAGGPMNNRPLRQAGFSVLKSADIPSVLVELGFLSSPRDLKNLRDPGWRDGIVSAMARAILRWHAEDEARKARIRR